MHILEKETILKIFIIIVDGAYNQFAKKKNCKLMHYKKNPLLTHTLYVSWKKRNIRD